MQNFLWLDNRFSSVCNYYVKYVKQLTLFNLWVILPSCAAGEHHGDFPKLKNLQRQLLCVQRHFDHTEGTACCLLFINRPWLHYPGAWAQLLKGNLSHSVYLRRNLTEWALWQCPTTLNCCKIALKSLVSSFKPRFVALVHVATLELLLL